MPKKTNRLLELSEEYFGYIAGNYPVMCVSDEFYFFPRVESGLRFLHVLDSLNGHKIRESIIRLKKIKCTLDDLAPHAADLESRIDTALLSQSVSALLGEFEKARTWEADPTLYLKIILLGIDQVAAKFRFLKKDITDDIIARIAQIPRLLREARENLKQISAVRLGVAREMTKSCTNYFSNPDFLSGTRQTTGKEMKKVLKKALESLDDFKKFLTRKPSQAVFMKDKGFIEHTLKEAFSYDKGLEEIFEIADAEYRDTLKELAHIAKNIDRKKGWRRLLTSFAIDARDEKALLELYAKEIAHLKRFLKEKGIIAIPETQDIEVKLTPAFMEPLRASASYVSPVTLDYREKAYFHVKANVFKTGRISGEQGFNSIHNEYIFITAHETYPGHHLLDSARRTMTNPIRRRIETPIFYEGWSSYAERLIDRMGYVKDPIQRLVGLKRQAWRAVRAMADVGIRTNKLKLADVQKMLESLGYESRVVKFMLRHYILLPGYQLCYTMGKFEIDTLSAKFSSSLGLKKFHDILLGSGQIPFRLIEKKMEHELCKKNS